MVASRGHYETQASSRDGCGARASFAPPPSLGCVGALSFKDSRRNRSPAGFDESVLEKLDRLRISSPKVLSRLRGFTSIASAGIHTSSHGRSSPLSRSPSILIRRTKSSGGMPSSPPALTIDPYLASGHWGESAGLGAGEDSGPMAPRSFWLNVNSSWTAGSEESRLNSRDSEVGTYEGGDGSNGRALFLE